MFDSLVGPMAKASRLYGGLAGVALITLQLNRVTANYAIALCMATAWLFVSVLCGKSQLVFWYFSSNRSSVPDFSMSWGRGFWGGLITLVILSSLFGHPTAVFQCGPAILVCYAISKISCWYWGCCNWNAKLPTKIFRRTFSLPIAETLASLLAAAFLVTSPQLQDDPRLCFSLFLLSHGLIRMSSAWAQGLSSLVQPSNSLMVAGGLFSMSI